MQRRNTDDLPIRNRQGIALLQKRAFETRCSLCRDLSDAIASMGVVADLNNNSRRSPDCFANAESRISLGTQLPELIACIKSISLPRVVSLSRRSRPAGATRSVVTPTFL